MNQAGHQIHQRGLARAVRADQAGDPRRNVERHTVHAQHLAIELRHFVEDDGGHDTTSTGRSLRSITATRSTTVAASAIADAPAPGPRGGSTPSSAHQTRFTVHAGS